MFDPLWSEAEWSQFDPGEVLSYLADPFAKDTVFAGPGFADLWIASESPDPAVMVSVSEVRPDGTELLVQNGALRLAYRSLDRSLSEGAEVIHDFSDRSFRLLRPGRFVRAKVEIPSFNHVFRAGSQLRLTIATPGRNYVTWAFENPGGEGGDLPQHQVARTERRRSSVVLSTLPGVEVPDLAQPGGVPPCPSLRGHVCRPYEPRANATVSERTR